MGDLFYTVFTRIEREYEAEFGRWQEQEHMPLLLTLPGYRSVSRYRCLEEELLYANFWHIDQMTCFENPRRKELCDTPWATRLHPHRHRRIDFFVLNEELEANPLQAAMDHQFQTLLIDSYWNLNDSFYGITPQYLRQMEKMLVLPGVLDIRIFHSYPQADTGSSHVLYYLAADETGLDMELLPRIRELSVAGSTHIKRTRHRCLSKISQNETT